MSAGDHRNLLFEVLNHPNGAFFAFSKMADHSAITLAKSREGLCKEAVVTMPKAIGLMGEKLRAGFIKARSSMYFDHQTQTFTHVHPDLHWGGKSWVLAATPKSLGDGIDAVSGAMSSCSSALISKAEIKAWAERQLINASYVVAFDDMPAWSLLVAETAMTRGWFVRPNPCYPGAPDGTPSMNPNGWGEWLKQVFETEPIRQAQAHLGFTTSHLEFQDAAHALRHRSQVVSELIPPQQPDTASTGSGLIIF